MKNQYITNITKPFSIYSKVYKVILVIFELNNSTFLLVYIIKFLHKKRIEFSCSVEQKRKKDSKYYHIT